MTAVEIPTPDPRTLDEPARSFAAAVAEKYAIKRVIGRGGMGIVYLARDRRMERLIAMKTLPPELASDASVRERFLRETRAAGAMSHPNIVPIHGADEIDGHAFFVMRYVEGDSLATLVRAHGRLKPALVHRYLHDVAGALAHAHARGIVHRDIKAENILIERDSDLALVTDFGIARAAEAGPLTATGQLLGTVYYVSPEQVSGEPPDARSDLYSLGVVGFFALTGRFPFESEVASAVLVAHVTKAPPPISSVAPDIPAALAVIVDRCLAKDPNRRYASADDLLRALDGAHAEVERHSEGFGSPPRLISDTEAHSVWQRAAELQSVTGIQPRPAALPGARALKKDRDRSRADGFRLEDVKSAADEAGIGEKYLEHALVEHGLSHRSPEPAARAPIPAAPSKRGWWQGGSWSHAVREVVVEGEVSPRAFDGLINLVRDATGHVGETTARSRELSWQIRAFSHKLEVSVVPEDGRTRIRASDDVGGEAVSALIAGVVLSPGAGFAAALLAAEGFGIRGDENLATIAVLAGAGFVGLSWLLARRMVRNAGRRVVALADAIAWRVRESLGRER